MLLWEAIKTTHYLERKQQRGIIESIKLPNHVYGTESEKEINTRLTPVLQRELDKRLAKIEDSVIGRSQNVNLGLKAFAPMLVHRGKKYPIVMDSGNGKGISYLMLISNDKIYTIYPTFKSTLEEIKATVEDFLRRERPEDLQKRPPAAYIPSYSVFLVDLEGNEVTEKEDKPETQKASEESLNYKLRTDYRVGAAFEHDQYGIGKVVAASSGGKAGTNGIVDWIEVDFGKPYLKGGKLQTTRRFENILTSAYFGKTLKKSGMAIKEAKSTCCGKCGHVHVKGTSCPKPYLTGKSHCSRRTNELHTLDQDGPAEFHQMHADHEESMNEMSLQSVGIPEFLAYVRENPKAIEALGFPSLGSLVSYVEDANAREWYELKKELNDYKQQAGPDEIFEFCPACLAEYLLEYEHKIEEGKYRGRKVTLGKPFLTPGGPKKRAVYVKNAKGNTVKVNFGDPNMRIKKSNPARRRSFRARHKCNNPGPRWKARYWSCKAW